MSHPESSHEGQGVIKKNADTAGYRAYQHRDDDHKNQLAQILKGRYKKMDKVIQLFVIIMVHIFISLSNECIFIIL